MKPFQTIPADYDSEFGSVAFANKHYWKLGHLAKLHSNDTTEQLKDFIESHLGHPLRGTRKRKVLCKYLDRIERGLVLYEECEDKDLIIFHIARRLPLPRGVKASMRHQVSRDYMANLLRSKDESLKFKRFMKLPPEIRQRILKHHMSSFDLDGVTEPPPITSVSRSMRHEALSVFFRQRLFICHGFSRIHQYPRANGTFITPRQARATSMFWKRAPRHFLSYVRRVEIVSPIGLAELGYAEWTINLGAQVPEERVTLKTLGTARFPGYVPIRYDMAAVVSSKFEDAVEKILARDRLSLEWEDAEVFVRALRRWDET